MNIITVAHTWHYATLTCEHCCRTFAAWCDYLYTALLWIDWTLNCEYWYT